MRAGRLPSARIGRRRLIRLVDLDAWLADRVAAAE
jgi:excisionase family DNA binding protein